MATRTIPVSFLLWLTACTGPADIFSNEVLFNGKIKDVNTGKPIRDAKVKLFLAFINKNGYVYLADSTLTDSSGEYKFSIRYNASLTRPYQYLVQTGHIPYYERCSNSTELVADYYPTDVFYVDVDPDNINTKNMLVGKTGEIKLIASHLQPEKKDTLFIRQDLESPLYVHVYCCYAFTAKPDSILLFKYFANQTSGSTLTFQVKKEDGTSSSSLLQVPIIADSTVTAHVDF